MEERKPGEYAVDLHLTLHREACEDKRKQISNYPIPGPASMEERKPGEYAVDLHLTLDREDCEDKRKQIEDYLDEVKKITRPGCSPEVLKVALSSISSLVSILSVISSSTILHASL